MSPRSSESLLRELAHGLPPVRPLPGVGAVTAAVLGVFSLEVALKALLGLAVPDFSRAVWNDFLFHALLFCLFALALAGTLAALLGAIPGRASESRIASGFALAGLLGAIAAGIASALASGGFGHSLPIQSSMMCTLHGAVLGFLPLLGVLFFLGRALTRRPLFASLLALVGAVGLGACFVHSTCSSDNAMHILLGHAASPLVAGLLLALPCARCVQSVSMRFAARN